MTVDDREFPVALVSRERVWVLYAGAQIRQSHGDGLVITYQRGETKTIVADTVLPSTLLKQNSGHGREVEKTSF
jgi:hypothetical protein